MQLQLAPSDSYKARVTVRFKGDLGKVRELHLKAEFRRLDQQELTALADRLGDEDAADNVAEVIRDNLLGWETFKDFAGNEVDYSEETVDEVLRYVEFRRAFIEEIVSGVSDPKGRARKN